ncbi:MAG: anti-sigma factor family protein [Pseudomonadota bacterium]
MTRPVAEDDLHAHADGRLGPERRAEVEAWLAEHPEDAARVAFYARLNAGLRQLYDPVLAEPIPAAMAGPPQRRLKPRLAAMAMACGWVGLGLVGGWVAHDIAVPPKVIERLAGPPPISTQAAIAHALYAAEVRHPVEVAAGEAHLVAWLSRRLGQPIKAPELEASGWRLMGGRLLPAAGNGVAAQFMYENARGNRVTLFIKTATHGQVETAFRFAEEHDGVSVFFWLDARLGYAMSGKLPREQLLHLARQVYEQLNS